MAETVPATGEEEFVKVDPKLNPRNIALQEIAKTVDAQHTVEFAETAPSIDDEGVITPAPSTPPSEAPSEDLSAPDEAAAAAEPPQPPPAESTVPAKEAPTTIDPNLLYDVIVDGQKMKVPGQKIIDAGFRTFQKETAADYRLQLASNLLQEAEARVKASTPTGTTPAPAAATPTDPLPDDIAKALQFGTPEEAAKAIEALTARGAVSQEQLARIAEDRARVAARDEALFQDAMKFVDAEYGDLLSNDYVRRLFFLEENRRRAPRERGGEADVRPYKDLYKSIGDDLRKNLNLPKVSRPPGPASATPPGSAEARQERKAATPPVPRSAAARLAAAADTQKIKTPSEIIAAMADARGKSRLSQPVRKDT